MIKAIIFDFDGVLVESIDIKTNAFAKLFEAEGESVVRKVVDYHLGNMGTSRFDKFRYIYKNILKRGLADKVFQELCDNFSKLVKDEVVGACYVKGAKEFLDTWSGHYSYYISSATPQDEIMEIVKLRNMQKLFKGVYGSPKGKPEIVKDIIRENGLTPREVMYVGDALTDYTAATLNSVNFIARICKNESIFSGIECTKLCDLTNLKNELDKYA